MSGISVEVVFVSAIVAFIMSFGSVWAIRKYAGPASAEYTRALEGQNRLLRSQNDDLKAERDQLVGKVEKLEAQADEFKDQIERLGKQVTDLLIENRALRLGGSRRMEASDAGL